MKLSSFLTIGLLFTFLIQLSAQKLFTKEGHITFVSDTPLEKIEAHNHNAISVVNTADGRIEFAVLIKAFQFEKALMQEHFNENYMESSKFPKAIFKGQIDLATPVDFDKEGTYPVKVAGTMTIHGVSKPLIVDGLFSIKEGQIEATSAFELTVADYDIKIPKLVSGNIANTVNVAIALKLEELKKKS